MTAVYVINLARSTDRLERITREFHATGLCFERVEAVDSSTMEDAAWTTRYDAGANRRNYLAPLGSGEIACMLSHRLAWEQFLGNGNASDAVILEDDVTMLANAADVLGFAAETCAAPAPVLCKLNSLRRCRDVGRKSEARPSMLPALTTAAQTLNRHAAQALLDFTESFHEPIDVALQRWWDHGVKMLQASPPLFEEIRGPSYASTIRSRREPPHEGRLRRELRRPIFQATRLGRALAALISGARP
ncbi:MAG: glycosyltransferase family 25 protein [Chthoniobacterales bacterium]|nr:glycosyltransferase family 25 protein [Chthoniobacterales bacterium]